VPRRPWWIPPILGRVPDVEPRLVRLLGLVTLALFFESYDVSMLTAALRYIAADLHIAETDLASYLATIRLGALPALAIIPLADRLGRRRMFLVSMVGVSVGTFLTAFSRTASEFVGMQMATRAFVLTGAAVAAVIVTEEFPAEHRGWGIGMMGALSACGFGLGSALFAAIDVLPYGWRSLYAVGLVPLLLLPTLRRHIQETDRFTRHRAERLGSGGTPFSFGGWLRPLASLVSTHPLRAIGITVAAGLFAIGETSVFQFTGYFTQHVRGWSPAEYSAMVLVGGGVGVLGNLVAGQLADRIGRRVVGGLAIGFFPAFAWLFYGGPGWSVPIAWTAFIFCETAAGAIIRAFSTELFPTAQRGTSAGWVSLVQTLGWAGGLWLVGLGTRVPGDIARLTSLVSLVALPGAATMLLLPETRRRELEAISPE
jgi:MFS family permease